MGLFDDAVTYFEARDYEVETSPALRSTAPTSRLVATQAAVGGAVDRYTLWCPELPGDDSNRDHSRGDGARGDGARGRATRRETVRSAEDGLLRGFAEARGPGRKILLVESRAGFSGPFLDRAQKDHHVEILVPGQLFDAPFKWDNKTGGSRAAASAARRLSEAGARRAHRRVAQPYALAQPAGAEGHAAAPDLLEELVDRFHQPTEWQRPVVLVTAPAGFGKSVLFEVLYDRLYQHFMEGKRHQRRGQRPLPLLPDYLGSASTATMRGLVESVLRTEIGGQVGLATFEWMLTRGYASLLIDGLDEIISRDPGFFDYLRDILTRPGTEATPRILLCVRDSLLSVSQGLRDFVTEAADLVTEYRLLPWEPESVADFARLRLGGQGSHLMQLAQSRPHLLRLCGTPYYAELLARRVESGMADLAPDDYADVDLVDGALRAMTDREYDDKGLLFAADVEPGQVLDFVGETAVTLLQRGPAGTTVAELAAEASALLLDHLDPATRAQVCQRICQLPVFGRPAERTTGSLASSSTSSTSSSESLTEWPANATVTFAQEVLFDYLVGKRASFYLARTHSMQQLYAVLGVRPFAVDSIALRVLRRDVEKLSTEAIGDLLVGATAETGSATFRNLLQVVLSMDDATNLLRQVPLAHQDLTGVVFSNVALDGVSLQGATLELTRFVDCSLTGADLTGAVLYRTSFEGCVSTLSGAELGDLAQFHSIVVDGQTVDSVETLRATYGRSRASAHEEVVLCDAARELRLLFGRFFHTNGLDKGQMLLEAKWRGSGDATLAAAVTEAAHRAGFLKPLSYGRFTRTRTFNTDMAKFVRDAVITDNIAAILHDTCKATGCTHRTHRRRSSASTWR